MSRKTDEYWIAIARTGEFADSSGRKHRFTPERLDEIVANYASASEEAPLVFGHPRDNQPACGWVKSLKREGERLLAQIAQVDAQTRKKVQDGLYKYVSMSLYPDGKRLRHVGLLGAVPPAISGLGAVQFGTDAEMEITLNFSAAELEQEAPAEEGANDMEKQVERLTAEIAELKAQISDLEKGRQAAEEKSRATAAEFSAYRGEVAARERKARLEHLTRSGRVKPAEHERINAILDVLERADEQTVSFASPEGTVKFSPAEAYWRELEGREPSPLTQDFSGQAPQAVLTPQPTTAPDLTHKI